MISTLHVLAILVVSAAAPAHAARAFENAPYLKTCEGFLAAVEGRTIEAFLMDQARTPAERGQVLLDYGLVFTPEYHRAAWTVLRKRTYGLDAPRLRAYVMRAIKWSPGEIRWFAAEVLAEVECEFAANDTPEGRFMHGRVARFRAELALRRDRGRWMAVYARGLRATLHATLNQYRRWSSFNDGPFVQRFGLYSGLTGLIGIETLAILAHAPLHQQFVVSGTIGLLTGGGGLIVGMVTSILSDLLPMSEVSGPWTSNGQFVHAHAVGPDSSDSSSPRPLNRIDPKDLTHVSPVILAYAGQLELSKLREILANDAVIDLRALDHARRRVRKRAAALAEDWTDARNRMRLAAAINDLIDLLGTLEKPQRERLETGRRLLDGLHADFDRIGRVPLDVTSRRLHEEAVLKREMLIVRRAVGVRELETLRIEDEPSRVVLGVVQPLMRELRQVLEPEPSTDGEWRRLVARAEEVLARVESSFEAAPAHQVVEDRTYSAHNR